jgi:hypothetical protein
MMVLSFSFSSFVSLFVLFFQAMVSDLRSGFGFWFLVFIGDITGWNPSMRSFQLA